VRIDKPIAQKSQQLSLRLVRRGQNASPLIFTTELFSMTSSRKNERRSEKRWEVCLDAVWEGKSGNYGARIVDLSEGGCYIDTLSEACVGELLNFKLQLPNGEWLYLTGEVAHQTPALGFGVRFVNLTEDQIEKLRSLISQLEDPHDPVTAIFSS
jgi:hypothetical protein